MGSFSGPGGTDVTAIILWDNKASSEAYKTKKKKKKHPNTYPKF